MSGVNMHPYVPRPETYLILKSMLRPYVEDDYPAAEQAQKAYLYEYRPDTREAVQLLNAFMVVAGSLVNILAASEDRPKVDIVDDLIGRIVARKYDQQ